MLDLYQALVEKDFKVWIDRKKGMAVENASIVIPMISTEYQNSENCEKELSYADTLKKNVIPVL